MPYEELSIPFDKESFVQTEFGIWPFCVHGSVHPEGHGGIDYELVGGSPIYSSCRGKVKEIEFSGQEKGNGLFINCKGLIVNYFGVVDLEVDVGDKVKKGAIIGYSPVLENTKGENGYTNHLHFEIIRFGKRSCPVKFMDEEFKAYTEELFESADYVEQDDEPLLCNCKYAPKAKDAPGAVYKN